MLAELERLIPLCLERGEAARIAETIRMTVGHIFLNCDRNEKRVLGACVVGPICQCGFALLFHQLLTLFG
jgi:hypothetical protein